MEDYSDEGPGPGRVSVSTLFDSRRGDLPSPCRQVHAGRSLRTLGTFVTTSTKSGPPGFMVTVTGDVKRPRRVIVLTPFTPK